MDSWLSNPMNLFSVWVHANFIVLISIFAVCLYINFNVNTVIVGVIYLAPLIPLGSIEANANRFLIVSFQNLVFGAIELVIFAITVQKSATPFDKDHVKQLFGHTLPVGVALLSLSFVGRSSIEPLGRLEFVCIATVFYLGSILRVLAVYQIGATAFKFDIVFRKEQKLKTNQLYGWIRHPSYFAMMLVIIAYAVNAHNLIIGIFAIALAWFGFQFRITHEEKALEKQFGEDYRRYQCGTGMWFPKPGGDLTTEKETCKTEKFQ